MEEPTKFSDLPLDCVKLIFNLVHKNDLGAASLVSHDFLRSANARVQELDLLYKTIPQLNSFSKLLQRFRNLKRLNLHWPIGFDLAGTLDQIADSGLDLEFLTLPGRWNRTDAFPREPLIRISSNMLNLKSMCCRYLMRDDDDMIALAEIFHELEDLDMGYFGPFVSKEGAENALTRFRKLRRIDLSSNFHRVPDAWLFSLSKCPLLEEVRCIVGVHGSLLSDTGVCALLRGCPNLRRVVIGGVHLDMINFPLAKAVCEAKNLRYLEINHLMMVDKDCDAGVTEHEEVSAAQIKEAFLSAAWRQLYRESY